MLHAPLNHRTLHVTMLSVVMLNVIILSVVAYKNLPLETTLAYLSPLSVMKKKLQ
jgi:hypothetical protein